MSEHAKHELAKIVESLRPNTTILCLANYISFLFKPFPVSYISNLL